MQSPKYQIPIILSHHVPLMAPEDPRETIYVYYIARTQNSKRSVPVP